ncbi:MAG: NADPH-dependent FMN reductase [Gaiellaceae bacterium]
MTSKPHILLIGGSHAKPSHTSALLRAAERSLAVRGATTWRWDIAQRPVTPIVPAGAVDEAARMLAGAAREADGLVVASPLYHGSFSGAVKDALDNLSSRELEGKPVALLSHSGSFPSTQALDHLRCVVRATRGLALPRQLVTVDADYLRVDDRYGLRSDGISMRLGALADDLLALVVRLAVSAPHTQTRRDAELVGASERR